MKALLAAMMSIFQNDGKISLEEGSYGIFGARSEPYVFFCNFKFSTLNPQHLNLMFEAELHSTILSH